MSYADDASPLTAARKPAIGARWADRALALFGRFSEYWRNRRALRQLSEMSDWQLADIGLTRSDVDIATLYSGGAAGTRFLGRIAQERARTSIADHRTG